MRGLLEIPRDLDYLLLREMSPESLSVFIRTCRRFSRYHDTPQKREDYWKQRCQREFSVMKSDPLGSFRESYVCLLTSKTKKVTYGSHHYLDVKCCLKRAGKSYNPEAAAYYLKIAPFHEDSLLDGYLQGRHYHHFLNALKQSKTFDRKRLLYKAGKHPSTSMEDNMAIWDTLLPPELQDERSDHVVFLLKGLARSSHLTEGLFDEIDQRYRLDGLFFYETFLPDIAYGHARRYHLNGIQTLLNDTSDPIEILTSVIDGLSHWWKRRHYLHDTFVSEKTGLVDTIKTMIKRDFYWEIATMITERKLLKEVPLDDFILAMVADGFLDLYDSLVESDWKEILKGGYGPFTIVHGTILHAIHSGHKDETTVREVIERYVTPTEYRCPSYYKGAVKGCPVRVQEGVHKIIPWLQQITPHTDLVRGLREAMIVLSRLDYDNISGALLIENSQVIESLAVALVHGIALKSAQKEKLEKFLQDSDSNRKKFLKVLLFAPNSCGIQNLLREIRDSLHRKILLELARLTVNRYSTFSCVLREMFIRGIVYPVPSSYDLKRIHEDIYGLGDMNLEESA